MIEIQLLKAALVRRMHRFQSDGIVPLDFFFRFYNLFFVFEITDSLLQKK